MAVFKSSSDANEAPSTSLVRWSVAPFASFLRSSHQSLIREFTMNVLITSPPCQQSKLLVYCEMVWLSHRSLCRLPIRSSSIYKQKTFSTFRASSFTYLPNLHLTSTSATHTTTFLLSSRSRRSSPSSLLLLLRLRDVRKSFSLHDGR